MIVQVFKLLHQIKQVIAKHFIFAMYYTYLLWIKIIRSSNVTYDRMCEVVKTTFVSYALLHLLPPATKLGQGYVFTGVCDSVNRGGGAPPQTTYPPDYMPPGLHTPPDYVPPLDPVPPQTTYPRTTYPPDYVPPPPWTVYVRAVRILLECILVYNACECVKFLGSNH